MDNIDDLAWKISFQDFYSPKREASSPRIFITFDFHDFAFSARSDDWAGDFIIRVASACCHRELIFPNTSLVRRKSIEDQKAIVIHCPGCRRVMPYNKFDLSGNVINAVVARFYDSMEAVVVEDIISRAMIKMIDIFRQYALALQSINSYKIARLEALALLVEGGLKDVNYELLNSHMKDTLATHGKA